jgi:hypothetical protein
MASACVSAAAAAADADAAAVRQDDYRCCIMARSQPTRSLLANGMLLIMLATALLMLQLAAARPAARPPHASFDCNNGFTDLKNIMMDYYCKTEQHAAKNPTCNDFCADKEPKELAACMEVCKVALRDCGEASCSYEQTITAVAEYMCGDVSQ